MVQDTKYDPQTGAHAFHGDSGVWPRAARRFDSQPDRRMLPAFSVGSCQPSVVQRRAARGGELLLHGDRRSTVHPNRHFGRRNPAGVTRPPSTST